MRPRLLIPVSLLLVCTALATGPRAQTPETITYEIRFPEPEHHWLEVEITFGALGADPLRARMSRSSPGRYAVHEFAKNIFAIEAVDGAGRPLSVARSDVDEWRVADHDGTVRLTYRVFGDYADGTYMAVDTTHAHLNMPATFMWAVGLEMRPVRLVIQPPDDLGWQPATQLFAAEDPFVFTAPNLQYFLDSPVELAALVTSTFTLEQDDGSTVLIRLMAHTDAQQEDVDALAELTRRVIVEQAAIFGRMPAFEPGHYTFLVDAVPWASGDAMEHRNSTVVTAPGAALQAPQARLAIMDSMAHEFFHVWNVERIRPAGLEPFDFTRENVTCCLWLAEGFTDYYTALTLRRAGLVARMPMGPAMTLINSPARQIRSAVEMSEHAPFADAGVANDVTDRSRTYLSYYTQGAAIALALDLSLRERSGGQVSLDDYMRYLWQTFGVPADPRPGYVARPYTLADLREALAIVAGDRVFADAFFDRHVEGREVPDYAQLLAQAGYLVEGAASDRGWAGSIQLSESNAGLLVGARRFGSSLVPFGTPAYEAGLDSGDLIVAIDGQRATLGRWRALADQAPGSLVALVVERRDGRRVDTTLTLGTDPTVRIAPAETVGRPLSDDQRAFRAAWLGPRVR